MVRRVGVVQKRFDNRRRKGCRDPIGPYPPMRKTPSECCHSQMHWKTTQRESDLQCIPLFTSGCSETEGNYAKNREEEEIKPAENLYKLHLHYKNF